MQNETSIITHTFHTKPVEVKGIKNTKKKKSYF